MRTIPALALLALLWLTMLLAGGPHSRFDPDLLDLIYAGHRPSLANAARLVTELGGWRVLAIVTAIAASLLMLRRRMGAAALLVLVVASGRLAVELQKLAIARLRPDLHDQLVPVFSLSFPSAHSANATITYLAIAWLLGLRRAWIAAAAGLAVAIGISRVMLGVHWPSDVIGGWSFGLFWLLAAQRILSRLRKV